jgi:hypothetical protein
VPSIYGLYIHVTWCRRVPNVPGSYIHVTVLGIERCQMCLARIYMLLYLVWKGAKCAWLVYTCYSTWYRKVRSLPGSCIHVTVLGIERCEVCLARIYMLLYLV